MVGHLWVGVAVLGEAATADDEAEGDMSTRRLR